MEKALSSPGCRLFMQNLTGLRNPELLIEIGAYFGRRTEIWISTPSAKRPKKMGFLKCGFSEFSLHADRSVEDISPAGGVYEVLKKF